MQAQQCKLGKALALPLACNMLASQQQAVKRRGTANQGHAHWACIRCSPRTGARAAATSALDNRSQEIVTQSLNQLRATRIVIAHRLSTVINADRIIIMDRGRIAQVGDYQALIDVPGIFRDLAKRQMLKCWVTLKNSSPRHSGESRNPEGSTTWTPAFAGVTD